MVGTTLGSSLIQMVGSGLVRLNAASPLLIRVIIFAAVLIDSQRGEFLHRPERRKIRVEDR